MKPSRPLIFISHDHRDASLAQAFAHLLTDASGGFLKSFWSSDRQSGAGIEFGAEWYPEIMRKIADATGIVALLTKNSIGRPWILYEAGVAKGKLNKPVYGIVLGVSFDQATRGPFGQFQNSGYDVESLTKLVMQLIRKNSEAEPREEAVRRQVIVFRESVDSLISETSVGEQSGSGEMEASGPALEQMRLAIQDIRERVHDERTDGKLSQLANDLKSRMSGLESVFRESFDTYSRLVHIGVVTAYTDLDPTAFKQAFAEAQRIKILSTTLSTSLPAGAFYQDILREAGLTGKTVDLYLCDPESEVLEIMSPGTGKATAIEAKATILASVRAMCELAYEERSGFKGSVTLYRGWPGAPVFWCDNKLFVGFYPLGRVSPQAPWVQLRVSSPLGRLFAEQFERLQTTARLETVQQFKDWLDKNDH